MKRILKNVCAAALMAGLCIGTAAISQAAWSGLDYKNECNTDKDITSEKGVSGSVVLVDDANDKAPDGTAYIKAGDLLLHDNSNNSLDIAFETVFSSKAIDTFCTWETDIKFTADNSGFSIRNDSGAKAGNINSTLIYASNELHFSSATGTKICDASVNQWYHIKLVGVYGRGESDAVMNITVSKYNTNGELETVAEVKYPGGKYGEVLRNDKAATRFAFAPGTCVDNVTAYEMSPAAIALTTETEKNADGGIDMKAGDAVTFGNTLYADAEKTMEMSGFSVVYEVWEADGSKELIDPYISITPEGGELTVSGEAGDRSFIVRAKCVDFPTVYADIVVNTTSVPMLEFLGADFKDDTFKEIVQLRFRQNYVNEGDMSLVAAVYDASGKLAEVYNKSVAYRDQNVGDLIFTMNQQLPEGFNKDTWTIKVFAWSKTIE